MKVTMTVCDVCEDKGTPAKHYEVRSDGRKVSVDLCVAHSQHLEAFLAEAPKPAKRTAQKGTQPRKRGGSQMTVTNFDEIESNKK